MLLGFSRAAWRRALLSGKAQPVLGQRQWGYLALAGAGSFGANVSNK